MDIAKIRKKLKESQPPNSDIEVVSIVEEIGDSGEAEVPTSLKDSLEAIEEIVELLVFSLSSEEYAFRVSDLEEIIRPQQITFIPKTPEYLLGITSLRGKIIPVVDLKGMLLSSKEAIGDGESKKQKIIILKGDRGQMGVRVDRITGVVRLPLSGLTECPSHLNESQLRFIERVAIFNDRFISIINTEEISKMASNASF